MSCRASSLLALNHVLQGAEGLQLFQETVIDLMILQRLFLYIEKGIAAAPSIADAEFFKPHRHILMEPQALRRPSDEEDMDFGHYGIAVQPPLLFIHGEDAKVVFAEASVSLFFIFPDEVKDFIGKSGIRFGRYNQ